MKAKIDAYFSDKEALLVEASSRLIAIPSIKDEPKPNMPFGAPIAQALEETLSLASRWGLPGANLEGFVGVVDLNCQDTALHILAHLDVVPPGDGWTVTEPFEAKLHDGMLYGRGSNDDKGPLVAALLAMRAVQDLGVPLTKNARLILGTDEESGFSDIDWYYARHPHAPNTFSPDASFPVTNIEKGYFKPTLEMSWQESLLQPQVLSISGSPQINVVPPKAEAVLCGLDPAETAAICKAQEALLGVSLSLIEEERSLTILCSGTGTHGSTPREGNNALTALLHLLAALPLADCPAARAISALCQLFPHGEHSGKALGIAQSEALSGDLTIALTQMQWTKTGFTARCDCRTPLSVTEENCPAAAKAAAANLGISLTGALTPPHHTPADSPFVQTLLRCYEQYTGEKGQCLSTGGGTYVHGIPGGVAYGSAMPGFDSRLHGPDERMSVADLLTSAKIFTQVIIDLCS